MVDQLSAVGPLHRISAAGGRSTPVTALDASRNQLTHVWPHFLPDGRHFLYRSASAQREISAIYVGSLDSTESRLLVVADSVPAYSPPGYLLFLRERTLLAQPFDAAKLSLTGDAFPIAEGI